MKPAFLIAQQLLRLCRPQNVEVADYGIHGFTHRFFSPEEVEPLESGT